MCLCKAFEVLGYLIMGALIVVVGGYIGKGLYLANDPTVHWHAHMIASGEFWEPDYLFWLFGILSLAFAIGLSIGIWLFVESVQYLLKKIFCHLCCWCFGCTSTEDDREMTDDGDYGFIMQEQGGRSSKRGNNKKGGRRKQKDDYVRLLENDYVPPLDAQDESSSEPDAQPTPMEARGNRDQKNISRQPSSSFVF